MFKSSHSGVHGNKLSIKQARNKIFVYRTIYFCTEVQFTNPHFPPSVFVGLEENINNKLSKHSFN